MVAIGLFLNFGRMIGGFNVGNFDADRSVSAVADRRRAGRLRHVGEASDDLTNMPADDQRRAGVPPLSGEISLPVVMVDAVIGAEGP